MSQPNPQLLMKRVKAHNWTSFERWDLMESLELIRHLRALPQFELAEILKQVTPAVAVRITEMIK